jgi:hypothetical protein
MTEDGNGDGNIYQLNFYKDGSACVPESFSAKPLPSTEGCSFEAEVLDQGEEFYVYVPSATMVYQGTGYCAECTGMIELKGTGMKSLGPILTQCAVDEAPEQVFNETSQTMDCMTCEPLEGFDGIFVAGDVPYTGPGGCSCTEAQLGTAYCDPGVICEREDNKYVLNPWDDKNGECEKCVNPIIKESDPDCAITVYPGEDVQ